MSAVNICSRLGYAASSSRREGAGVGTWLSMAVAMGLMAFVPGIVRGQDSFAAQDIPISGIDNPDLAVIDQMMVDFLVEHDAPGASLAISRNGQLVYARGFGYANREEGEPVEPLTRFRIASLSKPITGAAIAVLAQDGRLSLDDKLVAFMPPARRVYLNRQVLDISVEHLLRHQGGFDSDATFDPMFATVQIGRSLGMKNPASQREIIHYMLQRPLDFEPGSKYAYSNFGYCLLGRIIESASGQSYETFVQDELFAPLRIKSARLGRTLVTASDEATYYAREPEMVPGVVRGTFGKEVPRQYGGWNLEIMDAHGGWIASAPDMLLFADAFNESTDTSILGPGMIDQVFSSCEADADKDVYYGWGWQVRRVDEDRINTWHTGGLIGTSTLLVRRHDGLNWVVLFNSGFGKDKKRLADWIDPLIHRAVDQVEQWPETPVVVK